VRRAVSLPFRAVSPGRPNSGAVPCDKSRRGARRGLRLAKPVPERLERHSSRSVIARSDPVGLLVPEAVATLLDRYGPERPQQQDRGLA
jgi:hypothetical protein